MSRLDAGAFEDCLSLMRLTLPKSVSCLACFAGCPSNCEVVRF